jgi:hypothetical protein
MVLITIPVKTATTQPKATAPQQMPLTPFVAPTFLLLIEKPSFL